MDGSTPKRDVVRGPQPLHVEADDASGWARTYHVLREGREASERWNREYLERNGLVGFVEKLIADGVGVAKEPRPEESRAEGGDE